MRAVCVPGGTSWLTASVSSIAVVPPVPTPTLTAPEPSATGAPKVLPLHVLRVTEVTCGGEPVATVAVSTLSTPENVPFGSVTLQPVAEFTSLSMYTE